MTSENIEPDRFWVSIGVLVGIMAIILISAKLLTDDYKNNIGFIYDAVKINEETINGQYCVRYLIIENNETSNGKEMIHYDDVEKEKCMDQSDSHAINLHEAIKDRKIQLEILQNDPIQKKLLENKK